MPGIGPNLGAFLLILSFLGYMLFLRKVLKLQWEFIPITVFSIVALSCFAGGLFQQLYVTAVVVLLVGLGCFLLVGLLLLRKRSIRIGLPSISVFQIGFFGGTALFLAQLADERLIHYDNFSHWAIVLKVMLSADSFPTPDAHLIDFKNYPLGTSSFIYYICRFAGHSESMMLLAQGILIFACFYAIFGIVSLKRRFLVYAFLGLGLSALSFFNLTVRINNLLVDFLLPILALTIFAASYRYRSEPFRGFLVIAPVAALLTVVKTTGIIFAAIGLLFFMFMAIRTSFKISHVMLWKSIFILLFTIGLAMFPYFGWSWHMSSKFSHVENKFDLSASGIENTDAGKTLEQMQEIARLFLESSFDLTTRPAMGIFLFNIAAIIVSIIGLIWLKKKWNLWKALIALDLVVILYYVGILAMYLFMTPYDEAIILAGFERYASSIVVLFVGGLVMCATIDMERSFYYTDNNIPPSRAFKSVKTKELYQRGIWVCIGVMVAILLSEYNGISTIAQTYDSSLPAKVEKVTGDRWYADGKEDESQYLFYSSDANLQVTNYYLQYIARYYLFAPNVDGIVLFYEDNMNNLLSQYDYLVVVEKDDDATYLVKKHYHVDLEEKIYKIIKNNDQIMLSAVEPRMEESSLARR